MGPKLLRLFVWLSVGPAYLGQRYLIGDISAEVHLTIQVALVPHTKGLVWYLLLNLIRCNVPVGGGGSSGWLGFLVYIL